MPTSKVAIAHAEPTHAMTQETITSERTGNSTVLPRAQPTATTSPEKSTSTDANDIEEKQHEPLLAPQVHYVRTHLTLLHSIDTGTYTRTQKIIESKKTREPEVVQAKSSTNSPKLASVSVEVNIEEMDRQSSVQTKVKRAPGQDL